MPHINDDIYCTMGPPGAMNSRAKRWMSNEGLTFATLPAFLAAEGLTGTLNDMLAEHFYNCGAGPVTPDDNLMAGADNLVAAADNLVAKGV